MKKSRYAVAEEGDNGAMLLYSYATGAFLIADDGLYRCFQDAEPDIDGLLLKGGFLVTDDRDELEDMRKLFDDSRTDTSKLVLVLAPTYACNCRCAYCYEQDKATQKSLMTPEVIDAVIEFTKKRYEDTHFKSLDVQWYGGDPSVALSTVEDISQRLIALCDEWGVEYDAMMLSNCARVDDDDIDLLVRCRVSWLLITIDGPEATHNVRRPAPGVENPFQHIKRVINALKTKGIRTECMMNTDKNNMKTLPQLREELRRDCGVEIMTAKLNNYSHTYGEGTFSAPEFDLYTHEEYAHACHDMNVNDVQGPDQIRALLAPFCRFCLGQINNYFVVDSYGDVYKCDGWMGDKRRSIFNILTDESVLDAITWDPFVHDDCRACELLPVCWGNCSWERERCGWPCHPLKHTQRDYLLDLQRAEEEEK